MPVHAPIAVIASKEFPGLIDEKQTFRESFLVWLLTQFNGTKPTDLPIEQSTMFEVIVDLPIYLPIPPSIVTRVDEAIKRARGRSY
jgi:hypothetical protein